MKEKCQSGKFPGCLGKVRERSETVGSLGIGSKKQA